MLLRPGSLVICKSDLVGDLVLWGSPRSDSIDDDIAMSSPKDVLLIIKARKAKSTKSALAGRLSNEWSEGSYMVLTSSGVKGWVGAGWVVPVY